MEVSQPALRKNDTLSLGEGIIVRQVGYYSRGYLFKLFYRLLPSESRKVKIN